MNYKMIEKLMDTNFRLYAIESKNPLSIKQNYKLLSAFIGLSVYIWEAKKGLYLSDLPQVVLPITKTAQQVLNYIHGDHFPAIYVLIGFSDYVSNLDIEQDIINTTQCENIKRSVVMVDAKLSLSSRLSKYTFETKNLVQMNLSKTA